MPIAINGNLGTITGLTSAAGGGATTTDSAVDITLTSASTQAQNVAFTAPNKGFILPNATTMPTLGAPLFALSNKGVYTANIFASGGGRIGNIQPGATQYVGLSSASDANKNWFGAGAMNCRVNNFTEITFSQPMKSAGFASGATNQWDVVNLDASTFIVVYIGDNDDLYGVIGTISGTTVSFGTPQLLVVGTFNKMRLCALSATTGFLYATTTAPAPQLYGFSVSGTTISVSSVGAAGAFQMGDIVALDATRAVIANSNNQQSLVRVATYNGGSAPTFGSTVILTGLNSTAAFITSLCKVDTDKCVAFFSGEANDGISARVLSISSTTITQGASIGVLGTGQGAQDTQSIGLSTSLAYNTRGAVVSVSGTTLSLLKIANPLSQGARVLANLDSNVFGASGRLAGFVDNGVLLYGTSGYAENITSARNVPLTSTSYLCCGYNFNNAGSPDPALTKMTAFVVQTNI
jgi:hypothetical protein